MIEDDNIPGSSTLKRIAELNEKATLEQLRADGVNHAARLQQERLQNVESERQTDESARMRAREAADSNPYPHKLRD